MTTNTDTLARAWSACQSGNLATAVGLYRQAVRDDAANPDTWCMLGIVCRALGELNEAEQAYQQALRLRPDFLEVRNNLGNVLVSQGKLDEAIACYRHVLRFRPHAVETHNNLGAALTTQGKLEEAVACFRAALHCKPDSLDSYVQLGTALGQLGRIEEARAACEQALLLRPNSAAAHNGLGVVLARQEQFEEALAHYQQALWLQPHFTDAVINRGNVFLARRQLVEAEASYRQALTLKPNDPGALGNLGLALAEQKRPAEAEACYRQALALKPDHVEVYCNLGNALLAQGKLEEALAGYEQALRLCSTSPEAHFGRAVALLTAGDLAQGFAEYDWRWKIKTPPPAPPFTQPLWDGSPLAGRSILLHFEQGLGDTLQFIRYAPLVKERGGTVVVACQKPLLGLLGTCAGIDRLVPAEGSLPEHDVCASLLSLPAIFGTTLATVPAEVPYLAPDPERVAHWRQVMGAAERFKVGIAWQGSPAHKEDRARSVPLTQFAPLATVASVELFSLQVGPECGQLAALAERFPVSDLGSRFDLSSFADVAAVIAQLDLVVTVDTALAHLAGALGVPVWVLVPVVPDWRWLRDREDSPWYPTMRLFRQTTPGNWQPVFERVATALREHVTPIGSAAVPLTSASSSPALSAREPAPGATVESHSTTEIEDRPIDNGHCRTPVEHDPSAAARASLAADLIPCGAVVLDLGCGSMALEQALPLHSTYLPCDVAAHDGRTRVCDFPAGEFPQLGEATHLTVLGLLEQLEDVPGFLRKLRAYERPVILSYHPTDRMSHADRAGRGWVNHLTLAELERALAAAGLRVTSRIPIDANEVLFRLSPERPLRGATGAPFW